MSGNEKPIGYWLREADKAITARVNENLNKFGLTRFHWQVLNTISEKKEISKETIAALLSNFFGESELNGIIDDFANKDWVVREERPDTEETILRLTEKGEQAYADIRAAQHQTRMQLFEGLTQEDYDTTIKVLKKVIENAKK